MEVAKFFNCPRKTQKQIWKLQDKPPKPSNKTWMSNSRFWFYCRRLHKRFISQPRYFLSSTKATSLAIATPFDAQNLRFHGAQLGQHSLALTMNNTKRDNQTTSIYNYIQLYTLIWIQCLYNSFLHKRVQEVHKQSKKTKVYTFKVD